MEEEERQAVMRLMLMFIVAADRLAELGYDSRGVAGPVVAEVASFLGIAPDHRPAWVRQSMQ